MLALLVILAGSIGWAGREDLGRSDMREAGSYRQLDVAAGLPNASPHEELVNPFIYRLDMSAWDWVKVRVQRWAEQCCTVPGNESCGV